MERIIRFSFPFIFATLTATAGVTLVPSTPENSDDGYPVSRFGEAPADPMREYRADYPKVYQGNRAPAGLVFDDDVQKGAAAVPAAEPTTYGRSTAGVQSAKPSRSAAAPADLESPQGGTRRGGQDLAVPRPRAQAQPMELVPDRAKGVQEISIIAGELGFFPKTFFVSRDVPVRLFVTGASRKPLCIMMDSFQVRRQVSSQRIEEITFTPNVPGQYRFYCPMNGMEGTMVVKELASAGE